MSHIFISHVEEDAEIARQIADSLEAAGYTTWYYERDTVPGVSYLSQITQAINQSQAVAIVISPESVGSDQVTKEVVSSFERGKPLIPVLHNLTHLDFQQRQPEWEHAVAGTASISIGAQGVSAIVPRMIDGLKALGIQPEASRPLTVATELAPASYTPRHLADKIIAARPSVEGERKQVTVLIGDVTGFTSSTGKLDPEEEHSMIKQCLGFFADEIHRYEGTITQFHGDGVIALFGAPIAHEYASQRVLYAALGIQQRLGRYADQLKEEGIEFEVRIGVNTGPVVIARIGDDLSMEYTAIGDTVSLASEMNHAAEAGTICVAESTYGLTEDYFEFKPAGEVKAKGRKEPAKAYRVLGLGKVRTRLRAAMARGLTPLVGRERELELLMDGFERAKEGNGQALSIMGEAGVGKSRLLYEFRKAIASEDAAFLEGRCLSYSRGEPYHPVIDILKSNFDIREGDEDNQIRDKVRKGLELLGVDEASTLPYVLELLLVKDSGIDSISMSPEARKERTMEAVKRLVLKGSEMRPLILAVEDQHWIDRSTEDTLKYLLDSISGARVLMILTYRPDYVHTWGGRSYHSQVTLNRLSNRESLAMVANILGTEEIDNDLEELILEKTEGIPFFIEEFIKSLKDLGMIERKDSAYYLTKDVQDLAIPSTIQDVIMARVDSLPDAAKSVLQTGSAIEREFSYELIRRVTGIPELELVSHLSVLRDSELLYERGIFPQSIYVFKHALTREVVYDSILTSRKKRLHAEIGDAIEEIYRDSLNEHYEVLAEHYIAGENYEKGAEYCRLVARKAEDVGSLTDAIAYGEKRVASFERLPRTADVQSKIIDARATLGLYYMQMGYWPEAKDAIEPIVEPALELDYKRRLAQIYTIIGAYGYQIEEDFPKCFQYLGDALRLSEESNDIVTLALASTWLAVARSVSCEFDSALHHLEKALEIAVAANSIWGISLDKSFIAMFVYDFQGKVDLGYQTSDEALRIAEESGDTYSKATAYTCHGISCYHKGFLDEAEGHLLKGADYGEKINLLTLPFWATFYLGETYFDMGEYQKSQDYYDKALSFLERGTYAPYWINWSKMALARAKVMNNEKDIDLELLYGYTAENKAKMFNGWLARYIAEILLNINDQHLYEAEGWLKKAIEADSRNSMMFHLGKDYALYAEFFKRKGDTAKAKENLTKAIDIFKKCGADGWVTRTEETLASIKD